MAHVLLQEVEADYDSDEDTDALRFQRALKGRDRLKFNPLTHLVANKLDSLLEHYEHQSAAAPRSSDPGDAQHLLHVPLMRPPRVSRSAPSSQFFIDDEAEPLPDAGFGEEFQLLGDDTGLLRQHKGKHNSKLLPGELLPRLSTVDRMLHDVVRRVLTTGTPQGNLSC